MRKSRFSEAQIVAILREYDAGTPTEELARRHAVHANTIRLWRSKYAGMSASDLARLKQLEAENAQMQRIIAPDRQDRRHGRVDAKKLVEASRRAEAVKALLTLGLSQREACKLVHARRRSPTERASSKAQDDARLVVRLTAVAQEHATHGCRRLFEDYNRDADPCVDEYMNYKRFRRLYRVANLQFGKRRRRGRAKIVRGRPLRRATHPFEGWTLDFMHDRLYGGRAFRTLTMEDEFSRTGLALEMSFSFPSRAVVAVLDSVAEIYGYPKYLRIDNGAELTSKRMQQWSEDHDVELLFIIQPGKPTQNTFIESFNNRVRTELLNSRWFYRLVEAQATGYAWMHQYNTTHAHSALDYRTPEEFLATYETMPLPQKSTAS